MGGILFERNKALALLESLESSKDLIAGTTRRCLLFKIVGFISFSHLRSVTVRLSPVRFYLGLLEHSEDQTRDVIKPESRKRSWLWEEDGRWTPNIASLRLGPSVPAHRGRSQGLPVAPEEVQNPHF